VVVNGTSTTVDLASGQAFTGNVCLGHISGSAFFPGYICEAGLYPVGLTAAQMIELSANQRTYWGF
jgi:hypothetical protein